MNRKELERRFYNFIVRAENSEKGSMISGSPIVYNSRTDLGYFDEIIDQGALDGADLKDVRFLVNHDTSKIPLARSRRNNGNSTMQLSVNENGMDISANIDTENNADAKALYSAVQRGDISGMSFMFSIDQERWENLDSDHPTRHIEKIGSVVEVSAVTFPAYESTTIDARSKETLDNARSALENARQQSVRSLESDEEDKNKSLELEKAKTEILKNL